MNEPPILYRPIWWFFVVSHASKAINCQLSTPKLGYFQNAGCLVIGAVTYTQLPVVFAISYVPHCQPKCNKKFLKPRNVVILDYIEQLQLLLQVQLSTICQYSQNTQFSKARQLATILTYDIEAFIPIASSRVDQQLAIQSSTIDSSLFVITFLRTYINNRVITGLSIDPPTLKYL